MQEQDLGGEHTLEGGDKAGGRAGGEGAGGGEGKCEVESRDKKGRLHGEEGAEWYFVQGDAAMQNPTEGSAERAVDSSVDSMCLTMLGRSDDVMNVAGIRVGTGEVEAALLRHKQDLKGREARGGVGSPLANVIVVGGDDVLKGTVPVAFVVCVPGRSMAAQDIAAFQNRVHQDVGYLAVPAAFISVPELPETRSGKYLRRLLRNMLNGHELGNVEGLGNPQAVAGVLEAIKQQWHGTSVGGIGGGGGDGGGEDASLMDVVVDDDASGLASTTGFGAEAGAACEDALDEEEVERTLMALKQMVSEVIGWGSGGDVAGHTSGGGGGGAGAGGDTGEGAGGNAGGDKYDLETDVWLMHLGLDSAMLMMLRDHIEVQLLTPHGAPLPPSLLTLFGVDGFEAKTLSALAR